MTISLSSFRRQLVASGKNKNKPGTPDPIDPQTLNGEDDRHPVAKLLGALFSMLPRVGTLVGTVVESAVQGLIDRRDAHLKIMGCLIHSENTADLTHHTVVANQQGFRSLLVNLGNDPLTGK